MPSAEDAKLILQLYEMRREERMREARDWMAGQAALKTMDDFAHHAPPGSDANASFRQVTTYWEMVASFITAGVLDEQLFFQSGMELLFVWEKIRDLVPLIRRANGTNLSLRNLEQVAERYIAYLNDHSPGAYEAFSKRARKE